MADSLQNEKLNVRLNGEDKCWHHLHGVIDKPSGWVFVAAGDAGLTRSLKSRSHWVVQDRPLLKGGKRGALKTVGLLVPAESLKKVSGKSKSSASKVSARSRRESKDIGELEEAIVSFLAFRKAHRALAETIASEGAKSSAKVGSGAVGRTKTLPLDRKAELCARAYIRHQFTDYDAVIEANKRKGAKRMSKTSEKYKRIKFDAHRQVDAFIAEHR